MSSSYDENYDYYPERECCKEACIVMYHNGAAFPNCYKGTRDLTDELTERNYFSCNSSYMIVGVNLD